MKVISKEEWCLLCRSDISERVDGIIGTRCNPSENDVHMDECPDDAVVITGDIIDEIEEEGKIWYHAAGMEEDEDQQRAANYMIQFARDLRELNPNRSEIVKALNLEGKA